MNGPIGTFDRYWAFGQQAIGRQISKEAHRVASQLALVAGARVLDAGCGPGQITNHLARNRGYKMVGIDVSEELIVIARHDARQQAEYVTHQPHYHVADYLDWMEDPIPQEPFDGVLSWGMSWGYDTRERNLRFFSAAARVTAPRGKLLFTMPNPRLLDRNNFVRMEMDNEILLECSIHDPIAETVSVDRFIYGEKDDLASRARATMQLHSPGEVIAAIEAAGWKELELLSDPFENRLIVIQAVRP